MKRVIVIPTDFSIESLRLLKFALAQNDAKEVEVILLYSCLLPSSIPQLLFYSSDRILSELVTKEFKEACDILKNKYITKIAGIRIELFHGINRAAFENFIDTKMVEEAYIPKRYILKLQGSGFNPLSLIRKSKVKVHEVDWEERKNLPEKDRLAELFAD